MQSKCELILEPGLVLYLPLYQLDGVSFMSRDMYGHLGTVTGALWTLQGKSFDGVDDKIDLGDPDSLEMGINDMTILAWIKTTGTTTRSIAGKLRGGNAKQWGLRTISGIVRAVIADGISSISIPGTKLVNDDAWHQVGVVYDRDANAQIYADGLPDGEAADISAFNGVDISDALNCWIGVRQTAALTFDQYWLGTVGLVCICNRVLTPFEVQHNYLATK